MYKHACRCVTTDVSQHTHACAHLHGLVENLLGKKLLHDGVDEPLHLCDASATSAATQPSPHLRVVCKAIKVDGGVAGTCWLGGKAPMVVALDRDGVTRRRGTYANCFARASRVASMSRPLVDGCTSSGAAVFVCGERRAPRQQQTCGELCKERLQLWGNALAAKDIWGYCWWWLFLLCTFEGVKGGGWPCGKRRSCVNGRAPGG